MSPSVAWCTSSINTDRCGILPITLRNSLATSIFFHSSFVYKLCVLSESSNRSRITFSALVIATMPIASPPMRWLFIFWALGFFTVLLLLADFCSSSISNCMSCFSFLASTSEKIHEGSNSRMLRKLGMILDFRAEGARTRKLCAHTGLSGSFCAKYRSI